MIDIRKGLTECNPGASRSFSQVSGILKQNIIFVATRVINLPGTYQQQELTNDYMIRHTAADYIVPLITKLSWPCVLPKR